jgi:WD40 repeat protein
VVMGDSLVAIENAGDRVRRRSLSRAVIEAEHLLGKTASYGTYWYGDLVPSPDGSLLAVSGPGGTQVLRAADLTLVAAIGQPAAHLAWSPDGQRVATVGGLPVGDPNLRLFDAQGKPEKTVDTGAERNLVAFLDGDRVLVSGGADSRVVSLASGSLTPFPRREILSVSAVSGLGLFVEEQADPFPFRPLKLFRLADGAVLDTAVGHLPPELWPGRPAAFSPDGRLLAVTVTFTPNIPEGRMAVLHVPEGGELRPAEMRPNEYDQMPPAARLTFSPDGRRIYAAKPRFDDALIYCLE